VWVEYLRSRGENARRWADRLDLHERPEPTPPSVKLIDTSGEEDDALAALLFESGLASEAAARDAVGRMSPDDRVAMLMDLAGDRSNRRNRPGRGLESLRYRFEVVSDYAAFRDLQRHRMLTVQWQPLTPYLGADVPEEADAAGVGDDYRRGLELSRAEHERLVSVGQESQAMYALCFAYRIRYVMDMNAREAMHLIELRSGRQGHRNYREVAHRMHDEIARRHPAIASMMIHVDRDDDRRLERADAEAQNGGRSNGAVAPDEVAAAVAAELANEPGDDELLPLFAD
jgi:hypothetical protein